MSSASVALVGFRKRDACDSQSRLVTGAGGRMQLGATQLGVGPKRRGLLGKGRQEMSGLNRRLAQRVEMDPILAAAGGNVKTMSRNTSVMSANVGFAAQPAANPLAEGGGVRARRRRGSVFGGGAAVPAHVMGASGLFKPSMSRSGSMMSNASGLGGKLR